MPDEDSHNPSGRPGPQLLATERVMALRGLRAPSTEKAVGEEERLPKWDGHVNVHGGTGNGKGLEAWNMRSRYSDWARSVCAPVGGAPFLRTHLETSIQDDGVALCQGRCQATSPLPFLVLEGQTMFPGSTSVTVTRTPPREKGALYTGHIKDTWDLVSTSVSVSLCKSTHHT